MFISFKKQIKLKEHCMTHSQKQNGAHRTSSTPLGKIYFRVMWILRRILQNEIMMQLCECCINNGEIWYTET